MDKILQKLSFLAISNIKIKVGIGIVGACVAKQLGGWDMAIETLFWLMVIDYFTGLIVAVFWKASPKSDDGKFSSHSGFQGLFKKGAMLLMVYIAVRVELVLGIDSGIIRTGVIIGLMVNELGSIGENFDIMGVPFLPALLDAIGSLKDMVGKKER